MKKTLNKLLICICIIITLFNFIMLDLNVGAVQAVDDASANAIAGGLETESNDSNTNGGNANALTKIASGIVGVLTWMYRIPVIVVGGIIQAVGASVGKMAGTIGGETILILTPYEILFNKLVITDINFFDFSVSSNVVKTIREQIALWYYVMMVIASVILLAILIIVGIKMAITTVASEKAIYKKALFDWATSLALVFLLHFLIRAVIWVNSGLVNILANVARNTGLDNLISAMAGLLFHPDFFVGWSACIIYIIITIQTLMFLISYIKRMLVLAFLIIISPLITITYSIDKMGDQKAQALNTWLKEFMYNVLIQPFHCILYLAFVSVAVKALQSGTATMAASLLSILAIKFVWDGENIVRKIFGFGEASSLAAVAASGAVIGGLVSKARSAGSVAKSGIKFAKNSKTGQLMKQKMTNFKDNSKNVKGLSFGQKLQYNKAKNSGDEAKASTLEAKAHAKQVGKQTKRNNSKIHAIAEKNKEKRKETKDKIKNSKFGQWTSEKYDKIKNSELGQAIGADAKRYVRKLTKPETFGKIASATTIAAAMYALPNSNIVTAVGGGYAAGKSVETGIRNLRENKKEHFEDNVMKAWERHCDIKGISKDDRTREKFDQWYQTAYLNGKNMDAYSQKNMSKSQKEAEKELTKLGLDSSDIDMIIASIQRAILSKEDYNKNDLFAGYKNDNNKADIDSIANAVADFASKFNDSYTYDNAANYNEQMNQFGITADEALEGIPSSAFAKPSTQTEVETNTDTTDETIITETEIIDGVDRDIADAKIDVGEDADPNVLLSRLQDIVNDKLITIQNDMRTTLEQIGNGQEGNLSAVIDDLNSRINSIDLNSGNVGEQINTAISSAMSNINLEGVTDEMQSQLITNIKRYATTKVENNYISNNSGGGLDPNQIKDDLTKLLKNNK